MKKKIKEVTIEENFYELCERKEYCKTCPFSVSAQKCIKNPIEKAYNTLDILNLKVFKIKEKLRSDI